MCNLSSHMHMVGGGRKYHGTITLMTMRNIFNTPDCLLCPFPVDIPPKQICILTLTSIDWLWSKEAWLVIYKCPCARYCLVARDKGKNKADKGTRVLEETWGINKTDGKNCKNKQSSRGNGLAVGPRLDVSRGPTELPFRLRTNWWRAERDHPGKGSESAKAQDRNSSAPWGTESQWGWAEVGGVSKGPEKWARAWTEASTEMRNGRPLSKERKERHRG